LAIVEIVGKYAVDVAEAVEERDHSFVPLALGGFSATLIRGESSFADYYLLRMPFCVIVII